MGMPNCDLKQIINAISYLTKGIHLWVLPDSFLATIQSINTESNSPIRDYVMFSLAHNRHLIETNPLGF